MNHHVALLRGINVSGKRLLKMADLRMLCQRLGFENIETYLQSGNVVFEHAPGDSSALGKRLQAAIDEAYGYEVPTLVLPASELAKVAQNNPYLAAGEVDPAVLHVTFLESVPAPDRVAALSEGEYGIDSYSYSQDVIYLACPGGYGRTKLNNNFLERKLKVVTTTRNWKTVSALLEMLKSRESGV